METTKMQAGGSEFIQAGVRTVGRVKSLGFLSACEEVGISELITTLMGIVSELYVDLQSLLENAVISTITKCWDYIGSVSYEGAVEFLNTIFPQP